MPPRLDLLTKGWSTNELPVLPCLAPRAFAQWPTFGRRAHAGAQIAQEHVPNEKNHEFGLENFVGKDEFHQKKNFALLRSSPNASGRPKYGPRRTAEEVPNAWGNVNDMHGVSAESTEGWKENVSEPSPEEQFRKKYEEIWGTGKIDPSQKLGLPVGKILSKKDSPTSESALSLRKVQEALAEISRNKEKANPREGREAVQSHEGAALRASKAKHDEAIGIPLESASTAEDNVSCKAYANPMTVADRPSHRTSETNFRKPLLSSFIQYRQNGRQANQRRRKTGTEIGIRPEPRPYGDRQRRSETEVGQWRKGMEEFYQKLSCGRKRGFRRLSFNQMRSPKPPIKFARWLPGQVSDIFLEWQASLAALNRRLDILPKLLASTRNPANRDTYERLIELESSSALRKVWKSMPLAKRRKVWPKLMLTTFDKHPTKSLKVLAATCIEPYPPGYAISDSFDYIISYYLGNRTVSNSKNAREIFTIFQRMLHYGPRSDIQLSQKSIYLLLKNLDSVSVWTLFQLLMELGHPLTRQTLMHFPSNLKFSNGLDERIDILQGLWQVGSDFNSPEVLSVCATVLRRKDRSSEVGHSDSEVFEFMLKCGMKPNIIIYNVLLQNSLEANDHETAWQIHDMMLENGIDTDAYTYSLLLSDAKLRGDRPSIKHILSIVTENRVQNAHVATNILHTIYVLRRDYEVASQFENKGRPAKVFERMLSVYRQFFRLGPLTHIIPWFDVAYPSQASSSPPNMPEPTEDVLMEPAVPTLVVMLTALLRECNEPARIVQLYNHFCDLLQAGDRIAAELAKSTHVYNIILMALGRFPDTLALCPRLIGEMLSQNSTRHSSDDDTNAAPVVEPNPESLPVTNTRRFYPKPDIHTWSILLKIFMDHEQPRAAEKVLLMMEERQVWPNQVTWNSLIVGYARMQDMSMTVHAVDRLKRSKFDLDETTMKGLSFFQNRRALIEAMRASEARDPGRSRTKRPVAIGMAVSALNKTLKMVSDGMEHSGLQHGIKEVENDHDLASALIPRGEDSEYIVRDIPREEDEKSG